MSKSKLEQDLSILKHLDSDQVIQLIDSAFDYFIDPKSFPLQKLTLNIRAPFSAIYLCIKNANPKTYDMIMNMGLDDRVRARLLEKVSSIYAESAT